MRVKYIFILSYNNRVCLSHFVNYSKIALHGLHPFVYDETEKKQEDMFYPQELDSGIEAEGILEKLLLGENESLAGKMQWSEKLIENISVYTK